MSAVNISLQPHRALIFTDASVYDLDGRLLDLLDKCHITASGQLAVTGRGNAGFSLVIAKILMSMDIDQVEDDAGELIELAFRAAEPTMDKAGKSFNDVFIVGWSKRDGRPKIAQWSNVAPAGVPRFSVPDSVMAPNPDAKGFAYIASEMGPIRRDTANYEKLGRTIMEAQRYSTGSAEFGADGLFLVGGHVLMTEITAKGIRKEIVKRWEEDVIGEKIRPAARLDPQQHANVEQIELNRQQRRAVGRQAKQGRAA